VRDCEIVCCVQYSTLHHGLVCSSHISRGHSSGAPQAPLFQALSVLPDLGCVSLSAHARRFHAACRINPFEGPVTCPACAQSTAKSSWRRPTCPKSNHKVSLNKSQRPSLKESLSKASMHFPSTTCSILPKSTDKIGPALSPQLQNRSHAVLSSTWGASNKVAKNLIIRNICAHNQPKSKAIALEQLVASSHALEGTASTCNPFQ
jgi:hypothetical protein